jgi:hypothetical protein
MLFSCKTTHKSVGYLYMNSPMWHWNLFANLFSTAPRRYQYRNGATGYRNEEEYRRR